MPRTYKYIDADAKASIAENIVGDSVSTIDDATAAAWEADHYAHSVLLASATDDEEKERHEQAMQTIEEALAAAGK